MLLHRFHVPEALMKTDLTTKLLLALIALGLFMNAFKPATVRADTDSEVKHIADDINRISNDIDHITNGVCSNHSLCH
jgi:hypothetical protein